MTSTQTPAPRSGRRLLAGLSALALPSLLAGCALTSPMATTGQYNPGDGVAVNLGAVEIRDLLVVGTKQGEPATISAYVVNNSDADVTVSFTGEGAAPATLDVAGGSAVQASPVGEEGLTLESLGVDVGAMVPLSIQVDGNAPALLGVPSLPASLSMYTDLAPTGS